MTLKGLSLVHDPSLSPARDQSLATVSASSVEVKFPTERRIERIPISEIEDSLSLTHLRKRGEQIGVRLRRLIPSPAHELRVWQLIFAYRHVNGMGLDQLSSTDLIVH